MDYRAVNKRILVDLEAIPASREEIMSILTTKGFIPVDIDVCSEAKKLVGVSEFKRGAHPKDAPKTLDCSGLIKWVFGQCGLWLPRRTIQQLTHLPAQEIALQDIHPGDVIFRKGRRNYFDDTGREVGHAGLYVGEGTVVHAKNSASGIISEALDEFLATNTLTAIRRFIVTETVTVDSPEMTFAESSDDIRWIVLQELSNKS